jgi:phosphatidylinositol glycan class B
LQYSDIPSSSIRTFFEADEFWQGPEVAHRLVFGYGHLTWEWSEGLRSYLHPLLFAALFKIIALFRIDTPFIVALSPRLLQALFAAVADVHVYALAIRLFGRDPNDKAKPVVSIGQWALLFQLASWLPLIMSLFQKLQN